jgi:glycosyltransferase involved in cell wall biosynthesis
MKLSIVMPAYNEAATIRHAVDHVLSVDYPVPVELIVVDDGSRDDTAALLHGVRDSRLTVQRHPRNRGKGAALVTGLALAEGTHFLPFDADLEYSAFDIPALLSPILDGRAEVVYGSRILGLNTVFQSMRYRVGNRATTLLANVLYDSSLADMHTCLKLVPMDLMRRMSLSESGFGLDTEVTAKLLRMGYRPFEVPVAYHSRSHAHGKKITWSDGVECVKVLARVRVSPTPLDHPQPRRTLAAGEVGVRPFVVDLRAADAPEVEAVSRRRGREVVSINERAIQHNGAERSLAVGKDA